MQEYKKTVVKVVTTTIYTYTNMVLKCQYKISLHNKNTTEYYLDTLVQYLYILNSLFNNYWT